MNPEAEELWYDGVDQDCDGRDDDRDQDGFGVEEDCDDEDATVFPGARGWDAECNWTVEDDGSRTAPDAVQPLRAEGCSCDAGGAGRVGWLAGVGLGLLGLARRRR